MIHNKKLLSLDDADKYEINILFLLTKQSCDKVNKPKDNLTDDDIDRVKEDVLSTAQEYGINKTKICFYVEEKPENVNFNKANFTIYKNRTVKKVRSITHTLISTDVNKR